MFFFFFAYNNDIESVKQINLLLKTLERQLETISSKSIPSTSLVTGRNICNAMTDLLAIKEGLNNNEKQISFFQNSKTLYEHNILPKECYDFLESIRRYGNQATHGEEPSNRLLFSFLKSLYYVIQWFDNYFSMNYMIKFQIEECCKLIGSFKYDNQNETIIIRDHDFTEFENDNILQLNELESQKQIDELEHQITLKTRMLKKEVTVVKNLPDEFEHIEPADYDENLLIKEIESLREELKIKDEIHQQQIDELKRKNDELLKKIDENTILFKRCLGIIEEANEGIRRVESKVDDLHSKIDNITTQISTLQSLTKRQLDNAPSTEKFEEIMKSYVDECIDQIMKHSSDFKADQDYEIVETKLIYKSIGEEGWNKLCEKSKTFLITSKVMYNHLLDMEGILDYSGICVLVTKALEVELHRRFFTDFLDYLNNKYDYDYKQYPTTLLYRKRKPLFSETFTMGNLAYVMCYEEDKYARPDEKVNNKAKLMEYCKKCLFSRYDENEIEELLTKFASSIENIRENYRNPSAHTNEIKQVDAEECLNLVLDVEKLLKQMLDSFDY